MNIYLFLGTETAFWTLDDFKIAATTAKSLGVTDLLVKIGDGANFWYGSLGGWQNILSTMQKIINTIPYVYIYGNKFNSMSAEIALIKTILNYTTSIVLDMEVEWNGHTDWAYQLTNELKNTIGSIYITTWADPYQQNWKDLLTALQPITDFWMPQVYDNFLANLYKAQFSSFRVIPIFNFGDDFGNNDLLSNVKNAHNAKVGFWHYRTAISNYISLLKEIIAYMKGTYGIMIPEGWTDNGTTLIASNNVNVVMGFREHILNSANWDKDNIPLRNEYAANPVLLHNISIGGGTRQEFRDCLLWWTAEKGIVQEPFLGLELYAAYTSLEK